MKRICLTNQHKKDPNWKAQDKISIPSRRRPRHLRRRSMTPEEIVAKFAHALDNFEPIDRQPSDTDLTRLREAVTPLLLQILYDKTGTVHNLIGLIRPEAAYVARYGKAFPEPTRVRAYNSNIEDDTTAVVRAQSEADHKAKRADRATFKTERRETT